MNIYLASASPRRKEILNKLGLNFEVMVSDQSEKITKTNPIEIVKELAHNKAENVKKRTSGNRVIIGSDTLVCLDNEILGKPANEREAYYMLKKLSGKRHKVATGLSVMIENGLNRTEVCKCFLANVYFNELTDNEIENYINTKEPLDKAGAYAVQGIGAKFINKIEGDFFTIMGLPLSELYNILKENNVIEG